MKEQILSTYHQIRLLCTTMLPLIALSYERSLQSRNTERTPQKIEEREQPNTHLCVLSFFVSHPLSKRALQSPHRGFHKGFTVIFPLLPSCVSAPFRSPLSSCEGLDSSEQDGRELRRPQSIFWAA